MVEATVETYLKLDACCLDGFYNCADFFGRKVNGLLAENVLSRCRRLFSLTAAISRGIVRKKAAKGIPKTRVSEISAR